MLTPEQISHDLGITKWLLNSVGWEFSFPMPSRATLLAMVAVKLTAMLPADPRKPVLEHILNHAESGSKTPSVIFCNSIDNLRQLIKKISADTGPIGYWTGRLDALHQILRAQSLNTVGVDTLIIGLQAPYFSLTDPNSVYTETEIMLLLHLMPKRCVLFFIPQPAMDLNFELYHDWVLRYLELWQNPNVRFLGLTTDPELTQQAGKRRASPGNFTIIQLDPALDSTAGCVQ